MPDWAALDSSLPILKYRGEDKTYNLSPTYHAAENSKASIKVDRGSNTLGIHGFVVDQVVHVGDSKKIENIPELSLLRDSYGSTFHKRLWANWEKVAKIHEGKYPTGEDRKDAYWQTLLAGDIPQGFTRGREEFNEWRDKLQLFCSSVPPPLRALVSHATNTVKLIHRVFSIDVEHYKNTAEIPDESKGCHMKLRCLEGRRIFRTQKGCIGLAPDHIQIGDRIGIFRGGNLSLVIRPSDDTWELIGDSYVHGTMDGALFDDPKCRLM